MADDRQLSTQELVSAKYLVDSPESAEPEGVRPARRAQPPSSGLEQAMRWISPLVLFMLLAAGVGLYFKNGDSIRSTLGRFGERTSNPVDFALWLGGSKQTLREGFQNAIGEARWTMEDEMKRLEAEHPKIEFGSINLENAWSPPAKQWNPGGE
jgi:hypothetical protein